MHRMNSYFTSLDNRQEQFLIRIFGFDFSVQDIRIHLNRKLLLFGLDGAGKTTLLYKLTQDEGVPVQMTIPISRTSSKSSGDAFSVYFQNLRFTITDLGQAKYLNELMWQIYSENVQAVLFVVDSCDVERLPEARLALNDLLSKISLQNAIFLVLANKQKQPGARSCNQIVNKLNLPALFQRRTWIAMPCDAMTGDGVEEVLLWLSKHLKAPNFPRDD